MELNNATMMALLQEQEEREMAFFEAEVAAATQALYGKSEDVVKELTKQLNQNKAEHRERITALRQAYAAYAFGFQIDHALLLTSRALSSIIKNEYGDNITIPKQDVDESEAPTVVIMEDAYAFHI